MVDNISDISYKQIIKALRKIRVYAKEKEINFGKGPRRKIRRINGNWKCNKCIKKWRKEHREFLKRRVLGIRKRSDLLKEFRRKGRKKEFAENEENLREGKREIGKGRRFK